MISYMYFHTCIFVLFISVTTQKWVPLNILLYFSDLSGECPPIADNSVGTCVEECSTDKDCFMGLICCSNGCGHTCQRKYVPGIYNTLSSLSF